MARTSIQDVLSSGDPAQSWEFDMFFPSIPGSSNTRNLTYRCQSTDLPGTQLEPVDVALHGIQIPVAGRRMYTQTMNITFVETVTWEVSRAFKNWMDTARSWVTNSGSYFSTYTVTANIDLYDPIPSVMRRINIYHFFPSNVQEVQLDGSQSSAVQLSIEGKYVYWDES